MSDEEAVQLGNWIKALSKSVRYDPKRGTVKVTEKNLGKMTESLMGISCCKVPILIRLTRRDLASIPQCKVILLVSFKINIVELAQALAEYNPLILQGDVPEEERTRIIFLFQENNNQHRLLIGNLIVAGTGINLHDIHGGRPRRMYVIPNYSLLELAQASHRIYREGTQTDAYVRFVYGQTSVPEAPILNALAKKSKVVTLLVPQQVRDKVLFPGQYPVEQEA